MQFPSSVAPPKKQIIALGGGGFSMEASPELDEYVLAASGKQVPRICFVPTASGDSENYVARFYRGFSRLRCEASHLSLFRRSGVDPGEHLLSQDVIYVGGGNTANMLAIWKLHGVDQILRRAWQEGVVLAGVSAGALCWFEAGTTDSFGPGLSPMNEGLALLPGSICPHYDGEVNRRPRYHALVASGALPAGYAADDSVALHFVGTRLHRAVSSRSSAKAYVVERRDDQAVERQCPTDFLGRAFDPPEPETPNTVEINRLSVAHHKGVLAVVRSLPAWFSERGVHQVATDLHHQRGLVAERDGQVEGFVTCYIAEGAAHVGWMGVSEAVQRRGIGRALVERLGSALQAEGIKLLRVDTLGESIEYAPYALTRAFYRGIGFEDHATVEQDDPEWPERLTLQWMLTAPNA